MPPQARAVLLNLHFFIVISTACDAIPEWVIVQLAERIKPATARLPRVPERRKYCRLSHKLNNQIWFHLSVTPGDAQQSTNPPGTEKCLRELTRTKKAIPATHAPPPGFSGRLWYRRLETCNLWVTPKSEKPWVTFEHWESPHTTAGMHTKLTICQQSFYLESLGKTELSRRE